jgi:hypothetical protein
VQNLKEKIMLWWPYIWRPPLDCSDFWYIVLLTLLYYLTRGIWKHTIRLTEIIIWNFLENKRKYTCKAALVAGWFLSFPLLDCVYFWICGAPRCCLPSGRWRLETHTLARCRSYWTVACQFSG